MVRDHDRTSLAVSADESIATADISVSLGLIVTELVINALKHAFPDGRDGKILVDYRGPGGAWTLSVADDGVGMPGDQAEIRPGLGTSLIEALAKHLHASVRVADADPGTTVSIIHV